MEEHDKHPVTSVDMTKINPKWFSQMNVDGEVLEVFQVPMKSNSKKMSVSEEQLILQQIGESLGHVMKSVSRKLNSKDVHCKGCGGLKEEIAIDFDGKKYYFVCHRIDSLKTKKILKETDYEKFAEYLKPLLEPEK